VDVCHSYLVRPTCFQLHATLRTLHQISPFFLQPHAALGLQPHVTRFLFPPMTKSPSPDERRKLIWGRVYQQLVRHAIPDSRFNLDFMSFTPDFRGSSSAIDRLVALPCYKSAETILVTPDNSLEQLRRRALKDGKRVLVATYNLRRGFFLLHPGRINDSKFELAASLDGMEKPGIGRAVALAQMRDEGMKIDMCAIGGLAFNAQGVTVWEGHNLFEVQWAMLQDMKILQPKAPVIAVAHACQVVDEAQMGVDIFQADKTGEVQCDFVVTPEQVFEIDGATKPTGSINFDAVDPDGMSNIPPLQELRGIRMMEKIMHKEGFSQAPEKEEAKPPSADEQMGINIVEKLMQSFKA
jgi:5-formyltetrahydrofolate cyclo-ligase